MTKTVLITGGAGFIGSHLADELLEHGYEVRVLDSLSPQVHENQEQAPDYLNKGVHFIRGDVRDPEAVRKALESVDAVFHFAAEVGVGQSMYEIAKYTSANNLGTAVLLEAIMHRPVERFIVASSMSIYGEGLYRGTDTRLYPHVERTIGQLKSGQWEPRDEHDQILEPVPTPETKPLSLASIYALSKFDQERLSLLVGKAYDIPVVALRFFNAFGPRQALSNPYTGVLAIFASRYLNNHSPMIYEDGEQKRDFVSVYDVARAGLLSLETPDISQAVLNIGSGSACSILDVARRMARVMGKETIEPQITGKYRMGDIRHCFADISRARQLIGYSPEVSLDEGMSELAEWLEGRFAQDRFDHAARELEMRGLAV